MKMVLSLIILMGISQSVFAAPVPFEKIQEFHDDRVKTLLSNYGVDQELDVAVLISPLNMETLNEPKKAVRVRLPGLLLGGIEAPEEELTVGVFEIIQALKDYKRSVTIIKKKNVSTEDVEALKAGIREYLALRENETIEIQNNIFNLKAAMQNWKGDLEQSIYTSVFKSKFWAWVPLTLFVLFAFSFFFASAFKKVFKSLGESIEKSAGDGAGAGSRGAEGSMSGFDDISADSDFNDLVETEVDQLFEVDPLSILEKILALYGSAKFELFSILWNFLPSAEKQISFYELISAEADELQKQEFKDIFFEAFRVTPSAILNMKAGTFLNGQELANLHKSLLCAQLMDVDPKREKVLSAVYPEHGGAVGKIIEASLEQFFNVVYYLFPNDVLSVLSAKPELSKNISGKVAFYFSKSEEERSPNDLDIKGFVSFLEDDESINGKGSVALDEKTVRLLYNIPDSAIFNEEQWSDDYKQRIMATVPNVNWIVSDNPFTLKSFFLNITDQEMRYIESEHPQFEHLFNSLDERGRMRIQEKISKAKRSVKIISVATLRAKIKKVFKPIKAEKVEVNEFTSAA